MTVTKVTIIAAALPEFCSIKNQLHGMDRLYSGDIHWYIPGING